MCAAHRSLQHAVDYVIGLIDCGALAVYDEPVPVHAQRNRKSVFQSGEILIEFSEQAEMIG